MNAWISMLAVLFILSGCTQVYRIQNPTTYKGGDEISGERLYLAPHGEFEYERWEDFTTLKIGGDYSIKGNKLILDAAVFDDSLKVEERIVGDDSLYLKFELWDQHFENRIAPFTHLKVSLLNGEEVVDEFRVASGEIRLPKTNFRQLEVVSSGLLVKSQYEVQHNRANYFHCKFRVGNDNPAMRPVHFNGTRWMFRGEKVTSQVWIKGQKKTRLLSQEPDKR